MGLHVKDFNTGGKPSRFNEIVATKNIPRAHINDDIIFVAAHVDRAIDVYDQNPAYHHMTLTEYLDRIFATPHSDPSVDAIAEMAERNREMDALMKLIKIVPFGRDDGT